ncbi:bla regulator protein blaR1 [Terribacillus aidingensis]|uniref:Bla regulator protein blaR1 n=1 Tax=Terribacillus aidingensis TaxID=586416 RepID=A0A285NC23_9BACI|nr:BlaR1 family beta-lactam sensor/signal transducer [Terribacillus aidingensis]SNZ05506.1 bla regulator protein blaR1 [Terribacillus aidingensis]
MTFAELLLVMILSSATIGIILFIRRFLAGQLAPAWRYYLWFFLLGTLMLPFFPFKQFSMKHSLSIHHGHKVNIVSNSVSTDTHHTGWMNNFGTSVARINIPLLDELTKAVWITGVVIGLIVLLLTQLRLMLLINRAKPVHDKEINEIFLTCKTQLSIRKKIKLKQSAAVTSPFICGFFNTYLILPAATEKGSSLTNIKNVTLHELHHYKSRHVHWNYFFLFATVLHWFNPFVWYALKEMRLDREIACDAAVMRSLGNREEKNLDYGRTILHYAERLKQPQPDQIINSIRSSKRHLKKRIFHITCGIQYAKNLIWKTVVIFIVLGIVIASQIPVFSAASSSGEQYNIDGKNVAEEDLNRFFNSERSTFVLYSMKADKYYIHNKKQSMQRVSPNSTYKIFSALIALEAGVIQPTATDVEWDGSNYAYKTWNQNQNLQSAMKNSVTWYFQYLDQQVGKKTIQDMLEKYRYGNMDTSAKNFWLESSLKIAPFEQVELLRDFNKNSFGVKPAYRKAVKASMMLEKKGDAVLYGKTGTGIVNGKALNGWFIGFVETKSDTYYFAMNLRNGNGNATGSNAAKITLRILEEKQIYK